ncbi:hypothetical protein ACFFTN_03190 [Aminobacter aganoensis]|uniref:Uncharacterized protein n=1 Tax=Aminobacter aganoensis TaxID=83264 RepID=A0A7X0F6D5_9HYPH|nr:MULTISPECIES: hypothetical protein [Aminobacter]KQU64091.1 hypothetical protein ASC75_15785 [Aminobacter sp. DSM 101952]MBB6353991.1 hypothetical protein [Aminobacter aganoensis]
MDRLVEVLATITAIAFSWPDFTRMLEVKIEQTPSTLMSVCVAAAVHLGVIGYAFKHIGAGLGLAAWTAGMVTALSFRVHRVPIAARLLLACLAFAVVQASAEIPPI